MRRFTMRTVYLPGVVWLCLAGSAPGLAQAPPAPPAGAPPAAPAKDPFKDVYSDYAPDYVRKIDQGSGYGGAFSGWKQTEERMKLSSEPSFFTLNLVEEDARANALVEAALAKEALGQYREALKMYQMVIEKFPNVLYRVSKYGVFVPITQYCQRRVLGFPKADLEFYRTLYDARAKEAYEQARRQYSLIGLSEIVDTMLATSYGGRALIELGNAALDTGYYLAALEYFTTVRDFFPDPELHSPELALKIEQCQKMLGQAVKGGATGTAKSSLTADELARFRQAVQAASFTKPPFHSQLTSGPHIAADDYTLLPPTSDPIGLKNPVWSYQLPGARRDLYVFTQPVITDNSVIYRHKNIVYCHSVLNGELRWVNDLGGRAVWQNRNERMYPQEDVLVQDGLIFTTMSKAGPSLVAIDEVTGQLKWAYGPMVAANEEESRMRFEAAPTGGPRTVYAGYVLDNIEGETHTDTEYGVIAFDSATGRIHWRTPLCRLAPGKFAAGFAEQRRNRIRSFTSPPLYHEGTVYYNTNAGAIAAIDGQSGRIKWLERYPYYPEVHDATRQFGSVDLAYGNPAPHDPMFWYNQRPLLIGEKLYLLPVDTRLMLCVDRSTGKVIWSKAKGVPDDRGRIHSAGATYLAGPTRDGQLVVVYSGRSKPVQLLDPGTGETTWMSGDLVMADNQPVMKYSPHTYSWAGIETNRRWFNIAARPFIDTDGNLCVGSFALTNTGGYGLTIAWTYHMTQLSLTTRKLLAQRRFYTGEIAAVADFYIHTLCPQTLKAMEDLPAKDEQIKRQISELKEIIADHIPENAYGPFMPFSRITFNRYEVPFEFRFGPREIGMVYDRAAVQSAIASRTDPAADFARAELAVADSRFEEAATLLKKCLTTISSEDLDFRAAINQQLYRVHQRLARSAIRTAKVDEELANGLGMSRTASTLAEEMETLFALADAYEHKGDVPSAARCLRTVIETYGQHEYPVSPLAMLDTQEVLSAAGSALDRTSGFVQSNLFGQELGRSLSLMKKGLPLYLCTVSPLPKTLTVRAGERAASQLIGLQKQSADFAKAFEATATSELEGKPAAEQLQRLWEFPGTRTAQKIIDQLCVDSTKLAAVETRQRLWRLADAARVCGLTMPAAYRKIPTTSPDRTPAGRPAANAAIALPQQERLHDFADAEGSARLVLARRDDQSRHANLLFIGGRVKKRLDNKFTLTCMDLTTGKVAWETADIRLKGTGQEAGFYEAFVLGELVVVHGLYDVLAFGANDGKSVWSYRVPFDFEIKQATLSDDLLILSGKTETLALYVPTASPSGELAWQVGEMGDIYVDPYMRGERMVSVRKLPFNVTIRYRTTGKLIGRLDLPDLSLHTAHPLLEDGPAELPAAHNDNLLAVTDGWYYILIDTDRMTIAWKRLIDSNDLTREPAMRLALSPEYLCVLKEDYDQKAIYMLSAQTGEVLWQSNPKDARGPKPMHSVLIAGEKVYGITPHAGQGFFVTAMECKTGRLLFSQEVKDYQSKPKVTLLDSVFGASDGGQLVTLVEDRQDFEVKVFDAKTGKVGYTLKDKGVGPFGVHGRMSAAVQSGRVILLSKDKLHQ